MRNVRCGLGPSDPVFPERHTEYCVALVRRGTFAYRAHDAKHARDLREGWLLLGRHDAEYECAHTTCDGDDCTAVSIDRALLEQIRASSPLSGRDPFPNSVLPPVSRVAGAILAADRALENGESIDVDAMAIAVVLGVLGACGGEARRAREPSFRDRECVHAALNAIDDSPESEWVLGDLARLVDTSPFHFARAFRAIVGTTPHRYVVSARLRRAALLLLDTQLRITDIAFDVGFGDLSNFVNTFRREMGSTPRAFRAGGKRIDRSSECVQRV